MDKIIKLLEDELKKLDENPPSKNSDVVENVIWFSEQKQSMKLIFAMKYIKIELMELKEEIKLLKMMKLLDIK